MQNQEKEKLEKGASPPIFRTWTGWYILVLGFLFLQIIIYYIFTLYYR